MSSPGRFTIKARTLGLNLLFMACAATAQSPQYEEKSGPFTVYYSLFPSTFIKPDIAAAYAITRGKNNAVLNVSVRKTLPDGSDHEQIAIVNGHHSDLIHKTPLEFTEIREQGAVYYLAQITITGSPILYFDLQVQPGPNSSVIPIAFKQQLFSD